MNKHKQVHFIAILLLAFAFSPALVSVCPAQLGDTTGSDAADDSGSDEVDTDVESGGAGSDTVDAGSDEDTDSGEAGTGSPAPTGSGSTGFTVFQAAGPTAASIQSMVIAFRAALGEPNNANAGGPIGVGRREINWDGGGNNDMTDDPVTPFNVFLNTRGAQFITRGEGLAQAPPEGGPQGGLRDLFNNGTYDDIFAAFSPLRLFTPVGSNVTHALFFIPGMNPDPVGVNPSAPAKVRGFGAVFTDVDQPNGSGFGNKKSRTRRASTFIDYFDGRNRLLFRGIVPASPGDATFSFFGVVFGEPTDDAVIARVRIITGNSAPGPDDGKRDIVMMDDFIYGEPQPAP